MKKHFLFLFIISFPAFCKSQDIPDARRKTESFSRFRIPDMRADLATFTLAGIGESVNSTPLKKITYTSLTDDSIAFEGDHIKAIVKIAPFDPSKHKLMYDEKYLVRIDRKPYYGSFLKVPSTRISEVSMIIGRDTAIVPPAAYDDLFNLSFSYSDHGTRRTTDAVYISKDHENVYLYLFSQGNSDAYEVTWIFKHGKYFRRVLDYGIR